MRTFGAETKGSDTVLLHCTGHGVERDGKAYLPPGDPPFEHGHVRAVPNRRALTMARIAQACKPTDFNLMFFAACRLRVDAA